MAEIANLVVRYSADTKDAEAGASRVNSGISNVAKAGAALAIAGGALLGGFFAKSIMGAANFEQGMSGVAASLGGVDTAAGITSAQFQALSEEALRIGETTSVGATDAAMAMELLAKAGVDTESIINGTAQAVINVSEATGESVNQSASSLGSLSNLFAATGISGAEMADVIVTAMNASDATLSEFQTGIANLAPVIAGTGMEFDEAAGLISFFNAQGMAAAKVGSSLTSAYMNLINPMTDMTEAQQQMGLAVYDTAGNFRGLPAILDDVRTYTEGMDDAARDAFLTQLFGAEALDVVTMALEGQEGALEDHIDAMDESGAAATAAATRMDNLKGDVEQLKGAFETLSIRVGSVFLPMLRNVVQGLTAGMEAVGNFAESVIDLMDNGLNPVAAVFAAIGQAIASIGGENTPGPLATLARGFRDLSVLSIGLGEALGDVVDAFQDVIRGDFAGAWREVAEAANTAWSAISNIGSIAIDWVLNVGAPAFASTVADLAGQARDWIRGQIEGESGLLVDIAQVAINVLDAVANLTMADVTGQIQKEIDSLLEGVSFLVGGVKLVIGAITGENVSATGDIPGAIQTFVTNTKKEYDKLIDIVVEANLRFGGVSFGGEGDGGGGGGTSTGPIGDPRIQQMVDGFLPRSIQRKLGIILSYEITNIPGDVVALFDRIKSALGDIGTAASMAGTALSGFARSAANTLSSIGDKVSGYLSPISTAFDAIATASGNAYALITFFVDTGTEKLNGWGETAASALQPFEDKLNSIKEAINALISAFNKLPGPDIGELERRANPRPSAGDRNDMSALGNSLTSLRAQVDAAVSGITASLGRVGSSFQSTAAMAQAATTQLTAQVRAQFTAMQAAVNASTMQMVAMTNAQFTQMTAQGTASANMLRSSVQAAMTGMAAAGSAAMNQFASAVRSGFQQAVAAAQSGVAGIRGAVNSIGSLYGQGASIGASLGQGIAAGIQGQIGAVASAAAALVSAAVAAARNAGAIASPSKKTMELVGVPLGQGVWMGMESQRDKIASTFASMIPTGAPTGRGYSSIGAGYAARNGGGTVVNNYYTINQVVPEKLVRIMEGSEGGMEYKRNRRPVARLAALGTAGPR